jgi:hypothetical protein
MTSGHSSSSKTSLYNQDFYLWIEQTVQALKNRDLNSLDWENLIEEVEGMGRSEKRELKSRLLVVMEHLLKIMFWESEKSQNLRSWRNTVLEQRYQLELLLEDSPSLRPMLQDSFADSYDKARLQTLRKYSLPETLFPTDPPFSLEQVLDSEFLPE